MFLGCHLIPDREEQVSRSCNDPYIIFESIATIVLTALHSAQSMNPMMSPLWKLLVYNGCTVKGTVYRLSHLLKPICFERHNIELKRGPETLRVETNITGKALQSYL